MGYVGRGRTVKPSLEAASQRFETSTAVSAKFKAGSLSHNQRDERPAAGPRESGKSALISRSQETARRPISADPERMVEIPNGPSGNRQTGA